MNNRRTHDPSRSPRIAPSAVQHRLTWRVALALLTAVVVFTTSCGSSDGQVVDTAAEQASSSETSDATQNSSAETETTAEPLPTSTPAPPEPTAMPDQPTPEPPEPTTPPEPEKVGETAEDLALTGIHNFEFTPQCNLKNLIPDPDLAACETSGDLEYLPVLIPGTRTGTFDGTDFVAATIVVSPDGKYQFAGPGKFEGTVEGCGEGTVVYTMYGFGQFGTTVDYNEVVYMFPTESSMSAVAVSVAAEQTYSGPSGRQVSGTYRCDETGELPDAGVDPATAQEMYGPTFAASIPLCVLGSPLGSGEGTCETDGEHWFQSLRNRVQFTGSWEGIATFVGTSITSPDGFYEEAGMFLFEGTVQGCGEGTVILVNEASGRIGGAGLTHHRGYTPAGSDTGTLDVRADVTAVSTGPGGFEMQGTYSC
jgi:hypothetical protein